jgi:orotidine-5'-phosphate decarboxylase
MNFFEKLNKAIHENNSLVCVGLDLDPNLIPENIELLNFNRSIIDATADLVCAYKPNFAFYEALGIEGISVLRETIKYIPENIPVIGDAKRGDIGNTAKAYAKAIFDDLQCDATTVNPYLGHDSLKPFLDYTDKGIFILCRTSNPGAIDFQSLELNTENGKLPLFEIVAHKAEEWNTHGNIGLVVGATFPEELHSIRQNHPEIPLLIPGIGAQGGDLETVIQYGVKDTSGRAIVNSSRQIIYASREKDFAQAARQAAANLRDQINSILSQ